MSNFNLKEIIIKEMEIKLELVLSGESKRVELDFVRPGSVDSYLSINYNCDDHDFDCNGWQWDYWIYYKIDDKTYLLSGDGFYSYSATFELIEDKEE